MGEVMAQGVSKRIDAGDPLPRMKWQLIDGSSLTIPDDLAKRWAVLLLYRGHW
jgi:hypothetical protein